MLEQTVLKPYPREALRIRGLVDEVVRTKTPIDTTIKRPPELGTVTLCMLVKDEWQTLEEVIKSCLPLPTELIIGIDKETDSELSFAYREAFLAKAEKARDFFDLFMNLDPPRRATIPEIAAFMGIPDTFLKKRIDAYLNRGKPSYEIAKRMIEKVGKGQIVEIDFNNHFSNARNQILPYCTGDLCFFVDGHEYLTDVNALMQTLLIAEREHPGFMRFGVLVDMEDSVIRERNRQTRIWRNLPNARFNRGIHNQLVFDGVEEQLIEPTTDECMLSHRRPGWLAVFRETQRRKMIIDHMEKKDDASSLYYTGLSHQRSGNHERAIEIFNEYLKVSPPGPESAMVCWYAGRCYEFGLKDRENALKFYYLGIEKCPDAAFCHTAIAMAKLKAEEETEDEVLKDRLLTEALAHCRFAESSEKPTSGIAIPMYSYTWDPLLKKAETLRRLERFGESAQAIEQALQHDMDYAFKTQSEIAMMEMREQNLQKVDAELRESAKTGLNYIYVIDENQSAGRDIYNISMGMGFQTMASRVLEIPSFFRSDLIWVEHATENAYNASRIAKGDRRLIVRVYPEDLLAGQFHAIRWDSFTKVIIVTESLKSFIPVPCEYIPRIPDEADPMDSVAPDDVIVYVPLGQDKVLWKVFEMAMLTSRKIHVFGYVRDDHEYELFVSKCLENKLANVVMHWQVHPSEIGAMMTFGGIYVSLTDQYDDNIPIALSMGRKVLTTNPQSDGMYCASITDLAGGLLDPAECKPVEVDIEDLTGRIINALAR